MTKLLDGKGPVRRETAVCERGRPLVVELWPRYLVLRRKGDRQEYLLPYGAVLLEGARRLADREAAERRQARYRRMVQEVYG